ncbi:hypothetical protein GGI12_001006 [Dipsacomyces acuminosporus]|nr:hypothetical protein GGI12_001006 [Dipsacomyces acuminosporus]
MDYRAAATRQLKEAPSANAAKSNAAGNTQGRPSGASAGPLANDSNKMKTNASGSGRSFANAASQGGSGTNNNGGGSQPLSYAATTASGRAGGNENGANARKPAGRPAAAPGVPLTSLISTSVRVKLVNGAAIEGVVFTYDVYSGVLALVSSPGTNPSESLATATSSPAVGGKRKRSQVHLVAAANIKGVEVLPKQSSAGTQAELEDKLPEIRPVSVSAIEARKQKSITLAQERASRIGVGVSNEAQAIFEALSKTLPCRWTGNKITVLDEVTIESPYGVDDCKALSSASFSLQRVKKVLQGELSRMAQSSNSSTAAVSS